MPHSFRHTYGTRLGEGGADAFTIMKLMGHSTVLVSQLYVASDTGVDGEGSREHGGAQPERLKE